MARSDNTLFIFIIVGLLIIFGLYYVWNQTHKSKDAKGKPESYADSNKMRKSQGKESSDIEFIPKPDEVQPIGEPGSGDEFQLLGVADEEPAFQLGFGMGPGLYGSGRHTSEMVGN